MNLWLENWSLSIITILWAADNAADQTFLNFYIIYNTIPFITYE